MTLNRNEYWIRKSFYVIRLINNKNLKKKDFNKTTLKSLIKLFLPSILIVVFK
jgi:hypothetical protein